MHQRRETREKLEVFAGLLSRWNGRINLVSRSDLTSLWQRHILDSLQLVPLLHPLPARAIDLGSGAGFPGLVLALAIGIPFDLVEADQRRASFLRAAIRETEAPARVHPVRAEAATILPAPLLTARALAPLPRLLTLARPLLAPGGACLFPKGARAESELTLAESEWHMRVERFPSRTEPNATILRISEIARVGAPA
jgi:16S rRNA (guanine527-N7)-methyltransferase